MDISNIKRVVVKIGTSTLTHQSGLLNLRQIDNIVKTLADIHNSGKEIILVSSGAIGVGCGKLGLKSRPQDIPSKQAASAIGQCELMYLYDKLFSEYNLVVSQMLLTRDVIEDEKLKLNVTNTLGKLLEWGVIPIVNENDTVAVDEIVIGDNDTLSAVVAVLAKADLLVIMSDIDGLYDSNPKQNKDAKLIPLVTEITEEIMSMAGGAGSEHGTGGMLTKLHAGKLAMSGGVDMVIVNSSSHDVLYDLFDGNLKGTYFKS